MWIEIEFIGKTLEVYGEEKGRPWGVTVTVEFSKLQSLEKCSCGGAHQAKKLGRSQRIVNCEMHCPDPLLGKGLLA